jgi:hypothetical protein
MCRDNGLQSAVSSIYLEIRMHRLIILLVLLAAGCGGSKTDTSGAEPGEGWLAEVQKNSGSNDEGEAAN